MKKALLKNSAFLLFVFLFVALFAITSNAEDVIPEGSVSLGAANSFAIYNIETDTYIISKNASLSVDPASSVKIMSGLIICEALAGRENELVTLKPEMLAGSSGKSFGLQAGMTLTVKDLMIAAFSGGYNDATCALACMVSGDVKSFVNLMNETRGKLGMTSTYYVNATGLDDPAMSTTLADTVRAALRASRSELFLEVSSYFTYTVSFGDGSAKTVYGSNLIINENSPYFCRTARGMNSGMTDGGGACAVTYATYKGASYIAVAMGCPEDDTRFALIQDSLQYAYDNYSYHVYLEKGTGVASMPVELSDIGKNALAVLEDDLVYFAKNGYTLTDVRVVVSLCEDGLKAPVRTGDTIGYCALWDGDTLCSVARITVRSDVEPSPFLAYIDAMKSYLGGRAFVVSMIFCAIFTLCAIFFPRIALKFRQRRRKYVRTRSGFKLK